MASSVSSGWPGSGASPLPQNRVPIEKSLQWNLLSGIWPPAKLTELCSGQPQHGQVAQLLHFTSAHLHFLVLCPWVCAVWGQTWHRRQGCSLLPRGWGGRTLWRPRHPLCGRHWSVWHFCAVLQGQLIEPGRVTVQGLDCGVCSCSTWQSFMSPESQFPPV